MNEADEADDALAWSPPFCANDTSLDCPSCGAEQAVCVSDHEMYVDGDEVEAYCEECHAMLSVYAYVEVTFGGAEVRS